MSNDILEFYKKTSLYTDLGLYRKFVINLPNDINELCELNRNQIIHPFDLLDKEERYNKNSYYGDMTRLPNTILNFENDLYPKAIDIIVELLRRDSNYSKNRDILDKIHVCCREEAILLASILKAKGIAARVRSGFAKYVSLSENYGDHWITEYYSEKENRWILVDECMHYDEEIKKEYNIDFDLNDMPRDKFLFGAEAYLKLRKGNLNNNDIHYSSNPRKYGLEAAIRCMFYDFHSLMNDEIIFHYQPRYIVKCNYNLSVDEYKELDYLATLMLEPDTNHKKILEIWNSVDKYRIMCGGFN